MEKLMTATTDFGEWIADIDLEGHEEVYCLYNSVNDCDEWGFFKTELAQGSNTRWIVTSTTNDQSLLLASELAKETFLKHLEKSYCGDLTMEGWHALKHAMAKDD